MEVFYNKALFNIRVPSYVLTYITLLSPIRHCECLQILDVLYMAGGRGNNVLLPRDTSLLSKKFIEFP